MLLLSFSCSHAQDNTGKWHPSAEINFTTVPTLHSNGTDTTYQNFLSFGLPIGIRSEGGFGIIYTPWFVTGGSHPGIFMHEVTVGFEQYDREKFNLVADYNHYFFTGNNSIPTSPTTNEILLDATYKMWWLRPRLAGGLGFGINKEVSKSQFAYDIELAGGVSHSIDWTGDNDFTFNLTPSVNVNAGTNEYFSFLKLSKYISHSSHIQSVVKNTHASNKGRGNTTSSSTGSTTTTETSVTTEKIGLNNLEFNLESTVEHGSFSIRPSASLYLPFGKANSVSGYWEVNLSYYF